MDLYKITEIGSCKINISSCPKKTHSDKLDLQYLKEKSARILIISLLTYDEISNLKLENEELEAKELSIDFINFPISDMGIPGYEEFVSFIEKLFTKTMSYEKIIIHCKHGIGRSGLIALGLMVKNGNDLSESINAATKIRGYAIPQSVSQRKLLSLYSKNLIA